VCVCGGGGGHFEAGRVLAFLGVVWRASKTEDRWSAKVPGSSECDDTPKD